MNTNFKKIAAAVSFVVFSQAVFAARAWQEDAQTPSDPALSQALHLPGGDLSGLGPVPKPAAAPKSASFTGFPAFAFSDSSYTKDLLVKAIDSSKSTIETALFEITLPDVAKALISAKERGVAVRVIMDESHMTGQMSSEVKNLIKSGVNLRMLRGTRSYGVMHNKIGIMDDALLVTGSYNWTYAATFQNYDNVEFLTDGHFIDGYKKYWEWMWNYSTPVSTQPTPEVPEGYYGRPPADSDSPVQFNGMNLPDYVFSPYGAGEEMLLQAVNASQKSIDVASYSFYSQNLADALVRAKNRGVKVRVLMDANMGKKTVISRFLVDNGVEFRWMVGRNGKGAMHNKFGVFDGKLLETGSYNWTANAQKNCFENYFFTVNGAFLKGFSEKYDKLFSLAAIPSPGELPAPAAVKSMSMSFEEE